MRRPGLTATLLVGSILSVISLGEDCVPRCLEDPGNKSCQNCIYKNATSDMQKNCGMMQMVACDLESQCGEHKSGYCDPFSLLGDICDKDKMSTMTPCKNYDALCLNSSTVIKQCTDAKPIPSLPTSHDIVQAILGICESMTMEGCSQCQSMSSCMNPLKLLSKLCLSMPGMMQCSILSHICVDLKASESDSSNKMLYETFCDATKQSNPVMRMYFHTGLKDYVLFEQFVPETSMQYFFTILFVITLTFCSTLLKKYLYYVEVEWKRECLKHSLDITIESSLDSPLIPFIPDYTTLIIKHNICRSILNGSTIMIDYSLMLISMTFNAGLFVAIVSGYALSHLCFGHLNRDHYQFKSSLALAIQNAASEQAVELQEEIDALACC